MDSIECNNDNDDNHNDINDNNNNINFSFLVFLLLDFAIFWFYLFIPEKNANQCMHNLFLY